MRDTRVRAIRSRARFEIERRQRQRLVVDDLDRGAAATEHDHRAEGRVIRDAGNQLARLGADHHRLDGDAGNARVRQSFSGARSDVGGGLAHGLRRWSG